MVILAAAAWFGGCSDPPDSSAGTGHRGPGLAVICGDFSSTAVALLSPDGDRVEAPTLIHSGSRPPRLQTALSGDVTLPSEAPKDGSVLLIDRYPNAVITTVSPVDATVLNQVSVATGFASNPRDVLTLADGRWLVTRHQPNPAPSGADGDYHGLDGGDDILVLDPSGKPQSRLAMGDSWGPGRPDQLYRWDDGEVWVSLNRASLDWQSYAPGQLAVLSPTSGPLAIQGRLDLPGLKNCGTMVSVPAPGGSEPAASIAVACSGAFITGSGDFDAETSGLRIVTQDRSLGAQLDAADPRVAGGFSPAVTVDGRGNVLAVSYGDNVGRPDRVIRWTPLDDTVEVVYESSAPWTLWSLARAADGVVLVADGSPEAPKTCRLDASLHCLNPCAASGLPPLAVAPHLESP